MQKQQLIQACRDYLKNKINSLNTIINEVKESSNSESKSSAGDKHETALSMMHIEQEKLTHKLKEAIEQKSILDKIDASQIHHKVAVGSLVRTNNLTAYISVALPKITFENQNIFAISSQSPLGIQLMGKVVGFEFEVNGTKYIINEID